MVDAPDPAESACARSLVAAVGDAVDDVVADGEIAGGTAATDDGAAVVGAVAAGVGLVVAGLVVAGLVVAGLVDIGAGVVLDEATSGTGAVVEVVVGATAAASRDSGAGVTSPVEAV